jgi:hypothetical protein
LALIRVLLALAAIMTISACGFTVLGDAVPGGRTWVVTVNNRSAQPAAIFVAEDESPMGALVGRVDPNQVPALAVVDVTITVPPGRGWAVFVNPGPNLGALIGAGDVPPAAVGKLPITIEVGETGEPSVTVPAAPGWFGD